MRTGISLSQEAKLQEEEIGQEGIRKKQSRLNFSSIEKSQTISTGLSLSETCVLVLCAQHTV